MLPLKYQKKNNIEKHRGSKANHFEKETALIHVILLNKAFRVVVLLLLAATIIPIIVYIMVFSREIGPFEYDRNQVGTCGHLSSLRVSCGIQNMTEYLCVERGCCFSLTDGCYHSLPARHQYYNPLYITDNLATNLEPLRKITPLAVQAISNLHIAITSVSYNRVHLYLWKTHISNTQNVSMPLIIKSEMKENETTDYTFEFFQPVVYIEFRRKKDNSLLLTTSRGPLIAAENYLEWTFFLGSHHLFGLGELNLEPGFKSILLNNHLTNAVPFILAQNVTTKMFHGIYITSPYPVEIEITKSYLVIIRAIFDMSFQIDVLCGPTIDDMMNQLSEVTGLISKHYPAWQLGLHICDTNITRSLLDSINNVQKSLKIDMQVGNPFDSHCIREHLILLGDDEENVIKQINETIVILKEYKKKIMVHVATVLEASEHNNPAYQVALEKGILMRSVSSEEPYLGRLGNRRVAYIDWVAGDRKFLKEWSRIFWPAKLNADAYMLQSNWMQDDSTNIKISSSFPYVSVDMIDASMNITPWIIRQSDTSGNASIYSHNLIASAQIEILRTIIPNNTFIISESSLFGNVPTIRRHVKSTWRELTLQVRRIMGQAISGIYFTSSNVCGDEEVISEDLCVRWYQFASLSPIYRVSLSKSPYKFSRLAQKLIKASTLRRYSLLSYFRTIIDTGRPLFTPMFYEYPYLVPEILNLSHQVLLGSSLLFAPVLLPKVYSIIIFFPEVYYEIEGGQKLDGNKWIELSVVEADAPLFIRGGHIIPIYNTTNSLSISDVAINSVNLYVALVKSDANGEMSATGEILVDEHQRITLTAVLIMQKLHLSSTPQLVCSDGDMFTIDRLKVYGLSGSNVGIHVIYQDVNQNICQIELNFTMQISGI